MHNEEIYNPLELGFFYSIKLLGHGDLDLTTRQDIATMKVKQVNQWYEMENGVSTRKRSKTPYDLVPCGNKFESIDKETSIRSALHESYCLSNQDFTVASTFIAPIFRYQEIKVYKCDNATSAVTCATPEEIDEVLERTKLQLYFTNTNVDFDEFGGKHKKMFVDETFYWELLPTVQKKSNVYMRKDTVEFQDDLIQMIPAEKEEFYVVDRRDLSTISH